jgi:teichuronic acid biosynthesis glycosyltransferase TuaC
MSLRILLVTNMYPVTESPNWGTFVWQQVVYLERMGHKVDVYHINGRHSKLFYLKALFDVFFKTLFKRYDCIHAHYGLSGLVSFFRFRTPLITTFHGSDVLRGKLQPFLSRIAAAISDAVIVVSEELALVIPGIIIPCGVDTTVFKPMELKDARKKVNFPLDKKIILFPFNPARKIKRYDLALAAVNELKSKGMDVLLKPVYNIPNEKMPYYYAASDVMLLCSDSEGSPTSVKEALSCNIPVVATNIGDVTEIFRGIDNVAICKQTSTDIAIGIEKILGSNQNHFDGRSAMIRRYDQRLQIESILKVYESVITHGKIDPMQGT